MPDSTAIVLPVGDSTEIMLDTLTSAGYRWELQVNSDAVAVEIDDTPRARPAGPGTWEPGLLIRLTARHPGTGTVALQLRRPWENIPVRERSITVTVIATGDTG